MSKLYTKPFAEYYDTRFDASNLDVSRELEFFKFVFTSFAKTPVKEVLDVGCGTGRHYIPLVKEGYKVTGLDRSQNMLNTLKKKAKSEKLEAHVIRKDMKEMDFDQEFDAIITMSSAFMYLLTDEEILQALKAFQRALRPGGVAVIDIMNFLSLMGRYKENLIETCSRDNITYRWAIKHSVEDVPAIWNHQEFGIIEDNGQVMTYHEHHRLRMVNYNEMRRFLQEAGFSEIRCFGGFADREEVKSDSKRFMFVATNS